MRDIFSVKILPGGKYTQRYCIKFFKRVNFYVKLTFGKTDQFVFSTFCKQIITKLGISFRNRFAVISDFEFFFKRTWRDFRNYVLNRANLIWENHYGRNGPWEASKTSSNRILGAKVSLILFNQASFSFEFSN